jgi:hypothetical protein
VEFWRAVTDTTLSQSRGVDSEFATLQPALGDAFLRVQRTADGSCRSHLDVHCDDPQELAERAMNFGASRIPGDHVVEVLESPAGQMFCAVQHRGETLRPRPVGTPAARNRAIVDQLSIDIAPDTYPQECQFWSQLFGEELHTSNVRGEFTFLTRTGGTPLRLMLQRRNDGSDAATAHLDFSCDSVSQSTQDHITLGATVIEEFRYWTVMSDPSGEHYCLTERNPDWGFDDPAG